MASEKLVVNGALMLCSWTKLPTGDPMGNLDNFRIYRIVRLSGANNGIFGLDEAFLTENDAGPYLSMEPFPVCQSPDYRRSIEDIALYLEDLSKSSKNEAEKELIRQRINTLSSYAGKAWEYQNVSREFRLNMCLLELLDHWFNCSTTLYIDNYMQKLEELTAGFSDKRAEMKRLSEEVNRRFQEINGLGIKMSAPGTGKKQPKEQSIEASLEALEISQERFAIDKDGTFIADFVGKYAALCNTLESYLSEAALRYLLDGENKYVDESSENIIESVESLTTAVDDELRRMDGEKIRGLISQYNLSEEYQKLYDYINSVKGDFTKLLEQAKKLTGELDKQAVVTENSYLMCRCGGKISVIDGGQWVEEIDLKVKEDIENILWFAEKHIYGFLKSKGSYADEPVTEDYANTRYSVISALNGIHSILKSMGSIGKYMDIPDSDHVRKYYPLPNIDIDLTPQNELESEAHREAIVREAASNLPLGLKWIFKVLFFMEDMSNTYSSEESGVMKEVVSGIVEDGAKVVVEKVGKQKKNWTKTVKDVAESDVAKTLDAVNSSIKWYNLLHDLMTKSYAIFIGEIKIDINTGWDKYSFKANYDGTGNSIGGPMSKEEYLGRDMFTNLGNTQYDSEGGNYMYELLEGGMSQ